MMDIPAILLKPDMKLTHSVILFHIATVSMKGLGGRIKAFHVQNHQTLPNWWNRQLKIPIAKRGTIYFVIRINHRGRFDLTTGDWITYIDGMNIDLKRQAETMTVEEVREFCLYTKMDLDAWEVEYQQMADLPVPA